MKIFSAAGLFFGLIVFGGCFYPPAASMAQDLFLKKTGESKSEDKKAAPLFLGTGTPQKPKEAEKTNKPLFLDAPSGAYAPGGLFNPVEKSGKTFSLKKKDPKALTPTEQMDMAMEETRLANLQTIQRETLSLQSQTQAALAKWEADSAAEAARQAELEKQRLAQEQLPVDEPSVQKKTPLRRSIPAELSPKKNEANALPKPVFNTVR